MSNLNKNVTIETLNKKGKDELIDNLFGDLASEE